MKQIALIALGALVALASSEASADPKFAYGKKAEVSALHPS